MSRLDKLTEIGRAEAGTRLRVTERVHVSINEDFPGISIHLEVGTLVEVLHSRITSLRGVADLGHELMIVTVPLNSLHAFERIEPELGFRLSALGA